MLAERSSWHARPDVSVPAESEPSSLRVSVPQVTLDQAAECIFGVDRTTKNGQGTEFADVVTFAHWARGLDEKDWSTSFRIGVINYHHKPRIVRPVDSANDYWNRQMTAELKYRRPLMRMLVSKAE